METTFLCDLNGTTVYVACLELNEVIMAGPDDLMFYTDSDSCQGQCKKKELKFIMVIDKCC